MTDTVLTIVLGGPQMRPKPSLLKESKVVQRHSSSTSGEENVVSESGYDNGIK